MILYIWSNKESYRYQTIPVKCLINFNIDDWNIKKNLKNITYNQYSLIYN